MSEDGNGTLAGMSGGAAVSSAEESIAVQPVRVEQAAEEKSSAAEQNKGPAEDGMMM